jgi:serine/threonine protein kinase
MFCRNCGTKIPEGAAFCANCGAPVSDAPGGVAVAVAPAGAPPSEFTPDSDQSTKLLEMVKAELGRDYRIDKELGRGGMAVVYKGVEIALERTVALKVVPPDHANAGQAAERFRREAKLAASLDHPNIIPVYRVGQAGPLHYMAMKFVEGRAVDAVIEQQGALPLPVVVAILRAAAAGLGFAHERKIIHRDIKPANILIDKDGRVMVSDFGIARALEEVSMTASGMMIGTPYYMSPEQCGGQKVSPQSDQYSLGIMGFQMLTGEVPFLADSMVGVIQHHYMTPVPDILTVREGVPKELLDIVYCALNKDPNDRFPTTKDMAVALDNVPMSDSDRDDAEEMLKQLSAGQPITKVRTGTLPPLNLTISGPGPKVQPRPITLPRSRPTMPRSTTRRRRRKNPRVMYGGMALFTLLLGTTGYLTVSEIRRNAAEKEEAERQRLAADARAAELRGTIVIAGLPDDGQVIIGNKTYRNGDSFVGDSGFVYQATITGSGRQPVARLIEVQKGITDTVEFTVQSAPTVASNNPGSGARQAASSQPAAPTGSGAVRFIVSPLHAEIVFDGRVLGTGRVERRLPVGAHTVTFRAPSCDPETRRVSVSREETVIVPPVTLTCR